MADAPEIVVLLLGDEGCGKSTFLAKFSQGKTKHRDQLPSVLLEDRNQPFIYDIRFSKTSFQLHFHDTSSPSEWQLLKPDVVVLCYDIHQRLSLINVQRVWAKEVKARFAVEKDIPVLLLGLKRDLRSENDPNGIIYPQEGHRIAQELRCDKYMECSSKTGELVKEVFEDICKTAAGCMASHGGFSQGGCMIM